MLTSKDNGVFPPELQKVVKHTHKSTLLIGQFFSRCRPGRPFLRELSFYTSRGPSLCAGLRHSWSPPLHMVKNSGSPPLAFRKYPGPPPPAPMKEHLPDINNGGAVIKHINTLTSSLPRRKPYGVLVWLYIALAPRGFITRGFQRFI